MFTVTRSQHNPIISPSKERYFEAANTFNGCPVIHGKKTFMAYRAMSEPELLKEPHIQMSVIARAESDDGFHYEKRKILVHPDQPFDKFGCEDPRVTYMNGKYYIFYTALGGYPFSPENIRTAVAISDDFLTIKEKHILAPFNAKAIAMFPDKINNKFGLLITVNTDTPPSEICYAEFDSIEDMWNNDYWNKWRENIDAHKIHIRRLPDDQLEVGAPPVLTDKGWLVVYSHIQRYGKPDVVFGVETILLDKDNPRNVIGRTKGPFLVSEAYYEETGMVPHIVFPSGALIRNDKLEIFYGAADTHCAVAHIPINNLLQSITDTGKKSVIRFPGNPIIAPRPGFFFEMKGTLNPAAIDVGGKVHIFYRAFSDSNISTLGYANSHDGLSIDERSDKPVYISRIPEELPAAPNNWYGTEDPRLMQIGDSIYMTYTAYDGVTPRVAVTSIKEKDFIAKRWEKWSLPQVITAPHIPNKDAAILPEPINGKYMIFHRVHESICADMVPDLDFSKEKIDECIELIAPRKGMWDGGKVGIGAPPVKTKDGWLLLYHGVSWSTTYRVGAVLLDLEDPTTIKARTAIPLFEPQEEYEHKGFVKNVVFPCGLVLRKGILYMYYGAADSVIGVATAKLNTVLQMLKT